MTNKLHWEWSVELEGKDFKAYSTKPDKGKFITVNIDNRCSDRVLTAYYIKKPKKLDIDSITVRLNSMTFIKDEGCQYPSEKCMLETKK